MNQNIVYSKCKEGDIVVFKTQRELWDDFSNLNNYVCFDDASTSQRNDLDIPNGWCGSMAKFCGKRAVVVRIKKITEGFYKDLRILKLQFLDDNGGEDFELTQKGQSWTFNNLMIKDLKSIFREDFNSVHKALKSQYELDLEIL